ncbi:GNAT family N-acetyltransferase [Nonomuraea sp. NPDC000554]|uniref:GNAT family N-acetyltransferase n=1 Tax=Nonomuraea sp. NPDC000554 TaxID=3154259 RepID=UPI00332CD126
MLRDAEERDLATMRRWRNHPQVRAASLTTHEIGESEHARWWAAMCDDPTTRVLVYHHGDTAAGVVTFFGLGSGSGYWGFYLDIDGLSEKLLAAWFGLEREAIGHAFGPLGLTTLRGEVLAGNEAVMRLHHRFGFVEVGRRRQAVGGVRREVVTIQLTRKDQA